MVYTASPYGFKRAMFAEAAAAGASAIRLDLSVGAVYAHAHRLLLPDWSGVDEIVALSREYGIRVSAVVVGTPAVLQNCPRGTPPEQRMNCPPSDQAEYGRMIEEIAAHTRDTIDTFEIGNEPDNPDHYLGSADDYATTLSFAYDGVKAGNPDARVVLGGVMGSYSMPFLKRVLEAPGANAANKFDVAAVHARGTLAGVQRQIRLWKRFFATRGINRPLWVTEHGYPSDPQYQRDRRYRRGEASQAAYLGASIRLLIGAGVEKVFVTGRDNLTGAYASEGLVAGRVSDPPPAEPEIRRKPAFATFAQLAQAGAAQAATSRP
jgi:hypothetical protein